MSINRLHKHRCMIHFMLACCEDVPFVVLNMTLVLLQLKETKEHSEEDLEECSTRCDEWMTKHGNHSKAIVFVFMSSVAALTHKISQLTFLPSIWATQQHLLTEAQQLVAREELLLAEMSHMEDEDDGSKEGREDAVGVAPPAAAATAATATAAASTPPATAACLLPPPATATGIIVRIPSLRNSHSDSWNQSSLMRSGEWDPHEATASMPPASPSSQHFQHLKFWGNSPACKDEPMF